MGEMYTYKSTVTTPKVEKTLEAEIFYALHLLKKYCTKHKCDSECILYGGQDGTHSSPGTGLCRLYEYESPQDFKLREKMVIKVEMWKD